ncbi:MAG TPA: glycosyltransferase family 9 protein [Motilibacteraceae bacterium]|nr:glycosyltransferase family 9 protein [Motilibacteraceae bacterium]
MNRPRRALVARLDNDGDVLLAGPAVRAVAAGADEVVLLSGPRGRQAAGLLPGVDDVVVWDAPWVGYAPPAVKSDDVSEIVARIARLRCDVGIILTSFHQSPLPLALLLRLAGVPHLTAVSEDYPGSLLDVRHRVDDDLHEVERALSTVEAAGFTLPAGDPGTLAVRRPLPPVADLVPGNDYVVLHPSASVPARAPSTDHLVRTARHLSGELAALGLELVVTGGPDDAALTAAVAAAAGAVDLGARTSYTELAAVLAGARAVVVGNTGPAHLAAAVGTPVVSLFAPVVPAARWAPYGVPTVLLGDQSAACRLTRARECPVPGHPCLDSISAAEIADAVAKLLAAQA